MLDMPIGSLPRALFGLIQFALFGLLTAILAFKRPYLTLDVWVRRSPHDRGLSPAMWARDWFNVGLLYQRRIFSAQSSQRPRGGSASVRKFALAVVSTFGHIQRLSRD